MTITRRFAEAALPVSLSVGTTRMESPNASVTGKRLRKCSSNHPARGGYGEEGISPVQSADEALPETGSVQLPPHAKP